MQNAIRYVVYSSLLDRLAGDCDIYQLNKAISERER